jgi:hypothetical protein
VSRETIVRLVQEAQSFLWLQGIALFSYPKIVGFEKAIRAALQNRVDVRVLLMHPENPALEHILRDFAGNYVEMVRNEIRAGATFWKSLAQYGPLNIRFQEKGAMFGNLLQNDLRLIYTHYSLARATSESPTFIAPAGNPSYACYKQDFEWLWDRAAHDL